MRAPERLTEAYAAILDQIVTVTPGTRETPHRAAKAMLEMTEGYTTDIASLFTTFDSEGYDQMIAVTDIPFVSLCEHHALPFSGVAHIVYIPNGKVVGLSKIPRLVHAYAKRFQIQERLTAQIADALEEHVSPIGVMVLIEAQHTCMLFRGVKSAGVMQTSALRGVLKEDGAGRAEALSMIARKRG